MTILEAYKHYKNFGLFCLPTKNDKSPFSPKKWVETDFTSDDFKDCYGIGMKCGKISDNIECIDFDNHFGDAKTVLKDFLDRIKELYAVHKFPIESTVNGGYHLIYKCEEIGSSQKLASRPRFDESINKFKPDCIIETRGENSYFVCDPTEGYKWIRNSIDNIPTITKDERKLIIETCRSFNTWFELKKEVSEDKDKPGDLYNNSTDAPGDVVSLLKSSGWAELNNGLWRRQGKNKGISATLGKVAPNILYVFSSNAYPFEPLKAYSPFQVLALLKYNGDFKKCATDLADKYCEKKPVKYEPTKQEPKAKDYHEFESILEKAFIDVAIPIARPPVIMKIRDFENSQIYERRLFTLGNFSAITGKSKSKKSFLAAMLLAAAAKNGLVENKINGYLPTSKNGVLLFDTEQSDYDVYRYAKNVCDIIGYNAENFGAFALREYTPRERCEIIDHAMTKYKDNVSYIVIDGIADLATAINDELEATRVVGLIMKWTKIYNCHITVNIHQNKNDNFATGHLGSSILKKAEAIISVFKDEKDSMVSKVECTDIRGTAEFKDFEIEIQDNGIPHLRDGHQIANHYEVKEQEF
jgi:hypothetical protein